MPATIEIETSGHLIDNQFDPIEAGLGDRVRELLQAMLESELSKMLARSPLCSAREAATR